MKPDDGFPPSPSGFIVPTNRRHFPTTERRSFPSIRVTPKRVFLVYSFPIEAKR